MIVQCAASAARASTLSGMRAVCDKEATELLFSDAHYRERVHQNLGIENKLHYRRDEAHREDRCRLKGQGARPMAAINNLVLGLLRNHTTGYLPDVRRYYAAHFDEAVARVTRSPAPG